MDVVADEYVLLVRNSRWDFKRLLFALKHTRCRPKEARTLVWDQVHEDRWVLNAHKTAYNVGKPLVIFLTNSHDDLQLPLPW